MKRVFLLSALIILITPQLVMAQVTDRVYEAEITKVLEEELSSYDQGQNLVRQSLEVLFESGELENTYRAVEFQSLAGSTEQIYQVGDEVLVNHSVDQNGFEAFYIIDYQRKKAIFRYLILFVGLVVLVAKWKGVRALIGLLLSFLILFRLLLPWLQQGHDPIISAILASGLIMLSTFYLTHGVNRKTTIAIIGTLIALILTGILSKIMVGEMKLTGYGSEEANFLQFMKQGNINIQGLFLAGVIISVVGILDDITISQASVVTELFRANPKLKASQAFA
jgi:uncharacterized membrane protein